MVYVDDFRIPARVGNIWAQWSHLQADTEGELHEFAAMLGLKRSWYQTSRRPEACHYDVTDSMRNKAISLGAIAETVREGILRRRRAREAAKSRKEK